MTKSEAAREFDTWLGGYSAEDREAILSYLYPEKAEAGKGREGV